MATFRIQKTENYVVLDKGFLNNAELSWQAKGLLAYMLALPNDWTFSVADLTNRSKNGRDATKAIINELTLAGYIQKEQARAAQGKFGKTVFLVFETPNLPLTEKPLTDIPSTGKPSTENPPLLINKLLNNDLLNNNYDDEDDKKATPANQQQPKKETAYSFYEANGFGILASHVNYKIGNWIDDLSEELVIHAMKLAVENNAIRWNYVEKILKDWFNKKFTTLAQVEADRLRFEVERKQRTAPPKTYPKKTGRQEQVPDWFEQRNEPANEQAPEVDFEAERKRVLEKLGGGNQ